MNPSNRYIWDFWDYYDPETEVFHLFYLNAEGHLVREGLHHLSAQVGYATTKDFITFNWGKQDVLTASQARWDNTAIWTGDVIKIANGFLLFYTSRHQQQDDGMTQNIGVAYSPSIDTEQWTPIETIRIQPDENFYELKHLIGDSSIHAWRDPFLFKQDDQIFMLLSAKSTNQPLGKKGAIALLKLQDNQLTNWQILPPMSNLGYYSEMEVPQLFKTPTNNYVLVYSTWSKGDFAPTTNKSGGIHKLTSSKWNDFHYSSPQVLLPEISGLYACRIIPELDGEIIGFDVKNGGILRSGIKTYFQSVNRDFSDFYFDT